MFSSDRNQALPQDGKITLFVGDYRLHVSNDGETWHEIAHSFDRVPKTEKLRKMRLFKAALTGKQLESLQAIDQAVRALDKKIAAVPVQRRQPAASRSGRNGGEPVDVGEGHRRLRVAGRRAGIRTSPGAGALDRRTGQSAYPARAGESAVALPLRDGHRGHTQRPGLHGRTPNPSGAAGLDGAATHH